MSKLYTGAEIVFKCMEDQKVEFIFGYPGGAVLPIYDELKNHDSIKHILARHEQGAGHAAEGYARSCGKPGVVLVTSGPGATNVVTALTDAYMDSIPLVCISGQVPTHLIGTDAFQECDTTGITRPCTKHNWLVKDVKDLAKTIHKAFEVATTGRPGPVLVDIPKDIQFQKAKYTNFKKQKKLNGKSNNRFSQKDIDKLIEMMSKAKQPIFYTGGGVINSGPKASEQLRELVSITGFPITSTLQGLGSFPGDDNQFLGMLGMHGTYQANMSMHNADLIVAVGARFDDRITNTPKLFAPNAKIIHLDVDHSSVSKIIEANIAVFGQVKNSLQEIIKLLESKIDLIDSKKILPWKEQISNWKSQHGLNHEMYLCETDDSPIMPQAVVQHVYNITDGKAYITSDVGQHQMFAAQYYHFDEPRKWINSGGLGTMGFGLPAAMGVKLAFPDDEVVCITGEGSIQMCIQELSTCTQYDLPIKIININNEALGMVKQWQDMNYGGRHSASTYQSSLPNFVELVESYGHVGIRIEKNSELKSGLEKAFSIKDKLVFVDIYVDPNEHVYPMLVAPNGSLKDMWLDKETKT